MKTLNQFILFLGGMTFILAIFRFKQGNIEEGYYDLLIALLNTICAQFNFE